jgi:hypothetical protein
MSDYVRVQKQAVSNALGTWEREAQQAAADFKAKVQAALTAFNNAEWAGCDSAGQEFKKAVEVQKVVEALDRPRYQGGPNAPLNGQASLEACIALGVRTRNATGRSVESDAMQGDEMKKAQAKIAEEA